jgi:hypothetical protein
MKYFVIAVLAATLSSCSVVDGFSEGKAVEKDVEMAVGMRPQVGWQWHNGKFTSVMVQFPKLYLEKPLPELAETVRAIVVRDFKATPSHLLLSFEVGK